jgi:hypothetical protein
MFNPLFPLKLNTKGTVEPVLILFRTGGFLTPPKKPWKS